MASRPPLFPQRRYRKEINRTHSPVLASAMPWLSIMLASVLPQWLSIFSAAVLPPFGYLLLVAWRQVRPGVLPVWAGLPLGLFDDLYSGMPLGTGILLWSITLIGMELLEARYPWRGLLVDWLAGSVIAGVYIVLCSVIAGTGDSGMSALPMLFQIAASALLFPLVGRYAAFCDRLRLKRFRSMR
ncbi:MAG: rod shape-determining protein MreD [Novosphingobium sp.]